MDINQQLQPIVAGLLDGLKASIEQEVRDKISDEVIQRVANTELNAIVTKLVEDQLNKRIAQFDFNKVVTTQLAEAVALVAEQSQKSLAHVASTQITAAINHKLSLLDLNVVINGIVEGKIANMISIQSFPENSIPLTSVNFAGFSISGDQVRGGIIDQFGSTGIEDRASHVQMTLMDHATAFEGPIWAPSAAIKGDLTIDGDLVLKGSITTDSPGYARLVASTASAVSEKLNTELFSGFSTTIFDKIKVEGLDLDKITQGGKEIVKGNQLGYHITDTNIQRVGMLRDLQTVGENLLSDTLYVTEKRVGINTMDPSAALSIWDEEIEITASKRKQDVAYIGTPRRQQVIIGSNNKENIVLDVDGTVQIEQLVVGAVAMSSGRSVPNYEGQRGQIVWNEDPMSGNVIGWVNVGGTRWAGFGRIE